MPKGIQRAGFFILGLLLCATIFLSGFWIGRGDYKNYRLFNKQSTKIKNVDFNLFWDVWDKVDKQSLKEVGAQERLFGAIKGMVASLGDPYTVFLDPKENAQFKEELSGSFEGIGAEIGAKDGQLIIITPLKDSPANKAGLKPQDIIKAVDNIDTSQMTVDDIVSKIRGKAGTNVTLSILRAGWNQPKDFTITRTEITIPSVELEWKEDNIAYLKIYEFGDGTNKLIDKYADQIISKKAKGIIVDVRNNPGGYLDVAQYITSLFIDPGVVVQRKYKDGKISQDKTTAAPKLKGYKLVVLINEGSASASEIFAGAIQDYKRGKLIGVKTFGKGTVQDFDELDGGTALKITVAKWLTPSGREIDGVGIKPDIEVKFAAEQAGEKDLQLERALTEIK